MFYGLNKNNLILFFNNTYKRLFLNTLTELGEKVKSNSKESDILLTGCTEIPAILIAKIFCIKNIICTEFLYNENKIIGIKKDTFGNLKVNYFKKDTNLKYRYFTDDIKTEKDICNVMDNVILK